MDFELGEINPGAALLAILGGMSALIMAAKMETGIVMKIMIAIITTLVCYYVVQFIASK